MFGSTEIYIYNALLVLYLYKYSYIWTMTETLNIGKKICKIRELRGMKQEAVAAELGISQQAFSKIEQSAEVEESALQKIAAVLG